MIMPASPPFNRLCRSGIVTRPCALPNKNRSGPPNPGVGIRPDAIQFHPTGSCQIRFPPQPQAAVLPSPHSLTFKMHNPDFV